MNISFSMTTEQVRNKTKTVTRRNGWEWLTGVQLPIVLHGIEKGQGLKKGEKVVRLCDIRVVNVSREPIGRIQLDKEYGLSELEKEGFSHLNPNEFVDMYCKANKCKPDQIVTRIEFEYV